MNEQLSELGEALQRAAQRQLDGAQRRRRRWWSPKVGVAAGLTAVAVPAAALAATGALSGSQVASGLANGNRVLKDSHPICTVVKPGVEYHCTIANPPDTPGGNFAKGQMAAPTLALLKVEMKTPSGTVPTYTVMLKLGHGLSPLQRVHAVKQTREIRAGLHAPSKLTADNPLAQMTPAQADVSWLGTTELTVSASKRVNGGCRALNRTGTSWNCYIGEAAVRQKIIARTMLGQSAPVPTVG